MKYFLAILLVFSLVCGGLCFRLRRQADIITGVPGDITTQGSDTFANDKESGMKIMEGDLNNQESNGTPIKTDKITSMLSMAQGVGKMGAGISDTSKDSISKLMSPPKNFGFP